MTRRKRKGARGPGASDHATTESLQSIELIKDYYRIGQRASRRSPAGSARKPESIERLVKECGLESDTIRKARALAEKYTPSELSALLALRDAGGRPLGWAKVRSLLRLPSGSPEEKDARAALQKQAVDEGWSLSELEAQIRDHLGGEEGSQGGRPFATPRTARLALQELGKQCERWIQFCAELGGVEGATFRRLVAEVPPGEESAALGVLFREAKRKLSKLVGKAHEMEGQLDRARRMLMRRPKRSDAAAIKPGANAGAPKAKSTRKGSQWRSAK